MGWWRDMCCKGVVRMLSMGFVIAGQANYGYANGAVDILAEARKSAGLPALAIQWGPIADVGFVAEIMKVHCLDVQSCSCSMPQCLHHLRGD